MANLSPEELKRRKKINKVVLPIMLVLLIGTCGTCMLASDDSGEVTELSAVAKPAENPVSGIISSVRTIQHSFNDYSNSYNKDLKLRSPSPEGEDGGFLYQLGNHVSLGGTKHPDGTVKDVYLAANDNGSNGIEFYIAATLLIRLTLNGNNNLADSVVELFDISDTKEHEKEILFDNKTYNFSRSDSIAIWFSIEQKTNN